jgi:hypothetical protein
MEMGTGEFLSVFSRIVTRFCSAKLHFGPVKLIRVSLMYVYFEISQWPFYLVSTKFQCSPWLLNSLYSQFGFWFFFPFIFSIFLWTIINICGDLMGKNRSFQYIILEYWLNFVLPCIFGEILACAGILQGK